MRQRDEEAEKESHTLPELRKRDKEAEKESHTLPELREKVTKRKRDEEAEKHTARTERETMRPEKKRHAHRRILPMLLFPNIKCILVQFCITRGIFRMIRSVSVWVHHSYM